MKKKKRKNKKRNPIAKDLYSPKYKIRVILDRKKYNRKEAKTRHGCSDQVD